MKKFAIALAVLRVACAASGCVHEPTPVERAAGEVRLRCAEPEISQDDLRILQETRVVQVEPATFLAGASTRTEGGRTVSGTKLVVKAPPGVSAEGMARILRCHSARALLGQVDATLFAYDPFFLPDTWVDIDVTTENGFFVVKLSADRVWQNLAVLRRATAFAETHRPAPSAQ
jgi:hypothetical protein